MFIKLLGTFPTAMFHSTSNREKEMYLITKTLVVKMAMNLKYKANVSETEQS